MIVHDYRQCIIAKLSKYKLIITLQYVYGIPLYTNNDFNLRYRKEEMKRVKCSFVSTFAVELEDVAVERVASYTISLSVL